MKKDGSISTLKSIPNNLRVVIKGNEKTVNIEKLEKELPQEAIDIIVKWNDDLPSSSVSGKGLKKYKGGNTATELLAVNKVFNPKILYIGTSGIEHLHKLVL